MGLYRVRRGDAVFGAAANSLDVALAPAWTAGATLPLIGSYFRAPGGKDTPDDANVDTRDLSLKPDIDPADTSELVLTRNASALAEDFRSSWQLAEWLGAPASQNGWRVRKGSSAKPVMAVRLLDTVAAVDTPILGDIVDWTQCVPFVVGQEYFSAGQVGGSARATAEVLPSGAVRVQRASSSGTLQVYVVVVEFGALWDVLTASHTFTAAGADESILLDRALGSWSQGWIEATHRGPGDGLDEWGMTARPGATLDSVRVRLRAGASSPGSFVARVYVITHAGLEVEHLDSITGGESAHGSVQTLHAVTLATAVDQGRTLLAGSNDCGGTGAALPRHAWAYRLTGTTSVDWYRGRATQPADWALQAIQLPDVVDVAPAAARLELRGIDPFVDRHQVIAPGPARLELVAPAPASDVHQELTPGPARLELVAPAPALDVHQLVTPAPARIELVAPAAALVERIVVTPAPATIELRAALRVVRHKLTPAPAIIELVALPPATEIPIHVTPAPAIMRLVAVRSRVEWPGLCRVASELATTLASSGELPATDVTQAPASTSSVAAQLAAASTASHKLASIAQLSAELEEC